MEEDENTPKSLPTWVELEYMVRANLFLTIHYVVSDELDLQHMRTLAGPDAAVHFTHLSEGSAGTLTSLFAEEGSAFKDHAGAYAHQKSVLELMEEKGVPLKRVCLLDPRAEKELAPEDGDGRFEWFLFGVSPL